MIAAADQPTVEANPRLISLGQSDNLASNDQPVQTITKWTVHPNSKSPNRLVVIIFAALATLTLGTLVTHSILIGLLGANLLLASLKEFVFPITYILTTKSAKSLCLGIPCSEIAWTDIKTVYRTQTGLKLSPSSDPINSKVEHIRGVELNFTKEDRIEIEEHVQVLSDKPTQTLTNRSEP
jgi:hypothetical protein